MPYIFLRLISFDPVLLILLLVINYVQRKICEIPILRQTVSLDQVL